MRGVQSICHSRATTPLAALSGLVGVMIVGGVKPGVALTSASVVILSTLAGSGLLRLLRWQDGRELDRIAIAYAVGLLLTLATDQIGVTLLGIVSRWTPIVSLLPLAVWGSRADRRLPHTVPTTPTTWLVVAGGALLAVGYEWLWALPYAGVTFAVMWLVRSRTQTVVRFAPWGLLAGSLIGGILGPARRGSDWWLTQNDTHFYEALSNSLQNWGAQDFALASGSTLRYHWFSFAWVGYVTRLSGADDYVVLTRVAPLISAVGVLLCVVAVASRFVPDERLAWAAVVFVVSPVFGEWWRGVPLAMSGSFSQQFTMSWLCAAALTLLAWFEDPACGRLITLGIVLLALVGGKANHAVVVSVMISALWVVLALQRDVRSLSLFVAGSGSAVAVLALSNLLFGGVAPVRFLPLDWVPYVQGDLYGRSLVARSLAGATFLSAMTAACFSGAVWMLRKKANVAIAGTVAVVVTIASIGLSAFSNRLDNLTPNGLFFVHSAVALGYIALACLVAGPGIADLRGGRAGGRPAFLAVLGLAVTYAIPNPNSGSLLSVALRVSRSLVPVSVLAIAIVLFRSARLRRGAGVVVSSVLLALGSQAITVTRDLVGEITHESASGQPVRSTDYDISQWLRRFTPRDAIVSTNHLCADRDCEDPDRSSDAEFAVMVNRRFFVAAPLYSLSYSSEASRDPGVEIDRVAISIEFGRVPTAGLAATLRAAGVRWYVAERARSEGVDFSGVGDVRYENADYLVVELRDP